MDFRKPKIAVPDYEDLCENVDYAFTLAPSDKYQNFTGIRRIQDWFKDSVDRLLLHNSYNYCLYPEVSSKGRLHWHGTINIHNKNDFYIYVIPYWLPKCTFVIEDLDDPDVWLEYCTKQHQIHEYMQKQLMLTVPIMRKRATATSPAILHFLANT